MFSQKCVDHYEINAEIDQLLINMKCIKMNANNLYTIPYNYRQ